MYVALDALQPRLPGIAPTALQNMAAASADVTQDFLAAMADDSQPRDGQDLRVPGESQTTDRS